jgi:ubiquinone/menaquinone biosynthesis C-methylase UbiE
MTEQHFGEGFSQNPAENYERFFVQAIGGPLAQDLVRHANLQSGQRVLDVACGTGVVARLAAERTGSAGTVAGLDVDPAMLAVARSLAPSGMSFDWHEASVEAMPLPDESFDVVLCQMGLQFVPDKAAALREMRRVLVPGGSVVWNVPGPVGDLIAIFAEAMGRHVSDEAAGFALHVFSLHDTEEIRKLMTGANFRDVSIQRTKKTLRLPQSRDFLWQYVQSTPLAEVVGAADDEARAALEREVVARWQDFVEDGGLRFELDILVVTGRK